MRKLHLWFFLSIVIASACKKLDQKPEATLTEDAVFASEKGLDLYANSFYDILPDGGTVIRSDEMADYAARTTVPDLLRPGAFSSRQSSGWTWDQLRNINYFLEHVNNPDIAQEVRNHYTGIARFFRAWFYFDKV